MREVPQALSQSVPSSVPDLEETAPQPPCLVNAEMTKERGKITRLPTCGGSQMTTEDIREYISSSCAHMPMVLTSRGDFNDLEKQRQ